MKDKKKSILAGAAVIVLFMMAYMVFVTVKKNQESMPRVGLILSGAKEESGWNGMHYEGLKAACEKAGVRLFVKENVKEFTGECKVAVEELAKEQVDMIVLSSYGYSEELADVVAEYPEISFYANSSEYHTKNMTSYFVRMYQARYLSGVLAGMRTKSGRIGYVAAMPNNEVNRGISAFTLGVRSVNPEAEIVVLWSGDWDNREKEKEGTRKLIEDCQVDLVTYHQNGSSVLEAAEEYGIESIGYHEQYEGYSPAYLTSVLCHWDKVYSELLKELLSKQTNAKKNLWIGLREDAVGLSELSEFVSEEEKQAIEQATERLLLGQEVFSGQIYDTQGTLQCGEDEIISDEELLEHFDWYVMGVKFYEEER